MLQTAAQSRSRTHGKFIWCELITSDTAAAGAFYASVIGWKVQETSAPDRSSYFLFTMGEGEDCPGIGGMMHFPAELEGTMPPNWTGYVAVDDVDQTVKDYLALGGKVNREPETIEGIGRFAVVADPHCAVLCIMTPDPAQKPSREPESTERGSVGWHELYAGNGEEAFDFYAQVFGWTRHHDFDMGAMGAYRIFAHNDVVIGGMMTKPDTMPMPCWCYYFNVDAIDAAAERVKAGGGQVVNGPMPVPGDSWVLQATDPQGAFFCLLAPKR
jgi:predicted enzyme related to lactoylglutathione lyase